MEKVQDFEDMLAILERYRVRYLIIGGLAFTYHCKPRFTKDMDLWLDPSEESIERANQALSEFGAPHLLDANNPEEILQIGVAPDRIDIMRQTVGMDFDSCWNARVRGLYGEVEANWIDLDNLIEIKSRIDHPRHQADVRDLRWARDSKNRK